MTTLERVGARRVVVGVAAAGAAGLGVLALAGWVLGLPALASLGPGWIPMAPSTALLFLAHGFLLWQRSRPTTRPRPLTLTAASGLAALAAGSLLALSLLGIHHPAERLGLRLELALPAAIPVGHISPVTAACFLLASLATFPALREDAGLARGRIASTAAALILVVALVLALAYLYGRPLLQRGPLIPPAFSTTLALGLLAVALLAELRRPRSLPVAAAAPARELAAPLAIFLVLGAGTVAAGFRYYRGYERHYRGEVERQLAAIADLKVRELAQWRSERIGDGRVLLENESFAGLVESLLGEPGAQGARAGLERWLLRLRQAYGYERVFLVDPSGAALSASPPTPEPVANHLRAAIPEVLARREVRFLDFHRDGPGRPVHVSVLVPIRSPRAQRALAVLVLRVDAGTFLYPLIQRWPVPSRSAETLLVRRDGDHVLFLNELRFQRGTALNLRRPLTEVTLPAARAAQGVEGPFLGTDYRGQEVIAALRRVPGTPWAMVARIDAEELDAALGERLRELVLLVAAILAAGVAALALLWRRRSLRFFRERFEAAEALRASEAALRASDRELRERNDELSRFTYTVSHDLKSPLVTIQTFLGYLEQDLAKTDRGAVEKDLGFVRGAAQKMSRLLDELLQLSRIGRKVNPPVEVSLQELADEAKTMVAGQIAERGASVEVTDVPVTLQGDRARLLEVFQNLLDNAVKFAGPSQPRIEIGVERGEEPVIFVRDHGAGIDPRHLDRLFGLFEKLDPESEGTGIGLAVVRRIVEVHGGRIWAESEGPGKGACFRFTLAGTRTPPEERP